MWSGINNKVEDKESVDWNIVGKKRSRDKIRKTETEERSLPILVERGSGSDVEVSHSHSSAESADDEDSMADSVSPLLLAIIQPSPFRNCSPQVVRGGGKADVMTQTKHQHRPVLTPPIQTNYNSCPFAMKLDNITDKVKDIRIL